LANSYINPTESGIISLLSFKGDSGSPVQFNPAGLPAKSPLHSEFGIGIEAAFFSNLLGAF
jgi:hypothetical protein